MYFPNKIEDTVLVTHLGCMDGATCSILFRNAGGKKENVRFVAAGQVERFIKEELPKLGDKFVIFADVGLTRPEYADVLEKRGDAVMLDHHRTSLHLKGRDWCRIDAEGNGGSACGSELLRRYLVEWGTAMRTSPDFLHQLGAANLLKLDTEPYKKFTLTVDDFDRWQRREPMSEEMSIMMSFIGQEQFIERFMNVESRWCEGPFGLGVLGHWTESEEELLSLLRHKRDENITAAIKKAIVLDVMWGSSFAKVGYVISSEPNTSLMLDTLLREKPDLDVAVQVNLDKTNVSMRSLNGYDVSEMAKYFGGGGHQAASGHPLPQNIFKEVLELIHGA